MSRLNFLVVDDASFIRDLLKKNLRDAFPGCAVTDVPSASRAQVELRKRQFDLILCDWEMPEMSGEEFLRWLRQREEGADIPFIMVSSRGERDYVIKAVQAGATDYLGKPFKPETLRGKIEKALRRAGKVVDRAAGPTPAGDAAQGIARASIGVLTAGREQTPAADSAPARGGGARAQAQLSFAEFNAACVVRDLSLQRLVGLIKREDALPRILEPVTVSIVENDGQDVARLNAYVHALQAAENRMDAGVLKITVYFIDEDPQKLDVLSRFIARI